MVSLPHLNAPVSEKDSPPPFFHTLSYGVVIRCEVIFGSPSMDCRGTGICKIISTEEMTDTVGLCARFPAYVSSRHDRPGLLIFFSKDQLANIEFSRHFTDNTLRMDEVCPLPELVRKGLKTNIRNLAPGSYRLGHDGEYVFIAVDSCDTI